MRKLAAISTLALTLHAAPLFAEQLDPGVTGDLNLTMVLDNLDGPTGARMLPDGRIVIIRQAGEILVRPAAGGAPVSGGSIPGVSANGERGLLGIAVDPMFATTNRLYFYYTLEAQPDDNRHRVAYTTIDPTTNQVDVANMTVILSGLFGPNNHNGGGLEFSPIDGYLYVSVGDTGCNCGCPPTNDPNVFFGRDNNFFGTCLANMNGKILRIDREGGIPASNPLVGQMVPACGTTPRPCSAGPYLEPDYMDTNGYLPARAEIYNWGLRNPWRFTVDDTTGYLWIGDVGEVTWEEITISTAPGQHHGWPFREGPDGMDPSYCETYTPGSGNCKPPAYTKPRGSITGGVFSNDCSWPAPYKGLYWFSDYSNNNVWTLTPNAARDGVVANSLQTIVNNVAGAVHFFTGLDGSIYFVTRAGLNVGSIWQVSPQNPVSCAPDAGVAQDTGAALDAEPIDAAPMDAEPMDATAGLDATPMDSTPGDAGQQANDASLIDTGDMTPDAGAVADSGVSPTDSGAQSTPDSGAPAGSDAGGSPSEDAGATETPANDDCGCRTTKSGDPSASGLWLVCALLALRRRRHPLK